MDKVDDALIINFFEQIYPLTEWRQGNSSYLKDQIDHLKIFVAELMIYTVAILLEYRQYKVVRTLISNRYFVQNSLGRQLDGPIGMFCFDSLLLTEKNRGWISPIGHMFYERANHEKYKIEKLAEADLMIDYISKLILIKKEDEGYWPYHQWYSRLHSFISYNSLPLLFRLKSKRYVEETKELFDTISAETLAAEFTELDKYIENEGRTSGGRDLHIFQILSSRKISEFIKDHSGS